MIDKFVRLLHEYEGAIQEDDGDDELIAPARAALLEFLRPVLAKMKAEDFESTPASDEQSSPIDLS